MSRRLAVIAWIGATTLSVVVSTAAVASVRAQVTERPDVVSLATLRRATTTTTPPPAASPIAVDEAAAAAPITAPPETTTTTRPTVEATPATTVETVPEEAPNAPAPSSPGTAPPSDPPDADGSTTETRTFRGGTVTVAFDGESVALLSAVPENGYELDIVEQSSRRITVRFVDEGRSTALVAQVVRGELLLRVFE